MTVYRVHVHLIQEADGMVSAIATNLPGCVSQGTSIDDALTNFRDAATAVLETYRENAVPIPWNNEATAPPFSEKRTLVVRMRGSDGR